MAMTFKIKSTPPISLGQMRLNRRSGDGSFDDSFRKNIEG